MKKYVRIQRTLLTMAVAVAITSGAAFGQAQKPKAGTTPKASSATQAPKTPAAPAAPATQPSARQESEPSLTASEQEKLAAALEHFNKQDFSGALELLKEISASNPAARPPRVVLASWFSELQNMQAARMSLEMATEESPSDPEAYYSLAELSVREGALTAAELLVKRGDQALAKYAGNEKRLQSMTRASWALKLAYSNARQRWDDSRNAILGLIQTDGESAELDRAYARTLFQLGQEDKALQMFQRAESLDKENKNALPSDAAMAQLFASRGDAAKAKEYLDSALTKNPKSTPVLLLSIANALTENDVESAFQLVQRLYNEDKSAEVLKTYGKVALFRSDFKGAEAAFQEAVRQNPLDTEASGGLALALCEQGDAEKNKRAVQYAASNLQKQSNNREYLATLGWTLYMNGQTDEGFKALQQSIADGQLNAASAYYLAVILNDKGQTEAARQLLTAALATRPPFAKRAAAEKLLAEIAAASSGSRAPAVQQPAAATAQNAAKPAPKRTQPARAAAAPSAKQTR